MSGKSIRASAPTASTNHYDHACLNPRTVSAFLIAAIVVLSFCSRESCKTARAIARNSHRYGSYVIPPLSRDKAANPSPRRPIR